MKFLPLASLLVLVLPYVTSTEHVRKLKNDSNKSKRIDELQGEVDALKALVEDLGFDLDALKDLSEERFVNIDEAFRFHALPGPPPPPVTVVEDPPANQFYVIGN